MTECVEHSPRWVESASVFECGRCGALLPATTGVCPNCLQHMDAHFFFLSDRPLCPTKVPK